MGATPRIQRLKHRLLTADYEVCLARARHFTDSYRQTEGMDPALRNALALQRTLERQAIEIYADEEIVGSKTERYLATPLPVERGDFVRVLQLELDYLEHKQRPFVMSEEDRRIFRDEIVPYWRGKTLHDEKARRWTSAGLVRTRPRPLDRVRSWRDTVRFARYVGRDNLRKILGRPAASRRPDLRRLLELFSLRHELAYVQPTPVVYCMDVQGHICLGADRVVELGMEELIRRAREQLSRLRSSEPANRRGQAFLEAVVISLEAAIAYSERFAALAEQRARMSSGEQQKRLLDIAARCRRVPRLPASGFHDALQSAWMTHLVGEIQFGTMDVFAVGRLDQFLLPHFERSLASGEVDEAAATALLQEYFLKLSANISPTPELGMETNAVLGNSQHCVTIGGITPTGEDGTNRLSELILQAYGQMGGTVNQLCVRLHPGAPEEFTQRAVEVFRRTNGIAFYNDAAILRGLEADGFASEDARNYCIVGCVETCGHSDTQGCVAGHDFVLPAALLLTLTNGAFPPPAPGQRAGYASGDPRSFGTFEDLLQALRRQLAHQVDILVRAIAAKDEAHREMLPAPYVSALTRGCIESATDITAGGARYDFTSIDVRGLATLVDSLLAIDWLVYQRHEMPLDQLVQILLDNFRGHESLRHRLLHKPPKYGVGCEEAEALSGRVIDMMHGEIDGKRNVRGGRYRLAFFSLGNHVIDGFFLGATPDGRLGGMPISNGISPSNLVDLPDGPQTVLRSVAQFRPERGSSGVALNMRFYPGMIERNNGATAFARMLKTYFSQGGMHLQPNFVSTETLRAAQRHPDRYRDLVVKVSGYSACFTDLGRSIQEDIIARTAYGERK